MSLKKLEVKYNFTLKNYTAIKIGGKARSLIIINDRSSLESFIRENGFDFYILGRGSNLLISDKMIKKPILMLGKNFNWIDAEEKNLKVGASTSLAFLIKYCIDNKLCGLENLTGIPASVGGLLAMNASSYGVSISDFLESVEVIDKNGSIKTILKKDIVFDYRYSSLDEYFILSAEFALSKCNSLKQKISSLLKKRLNSQDFSCPSCGSIFKNSRKSSAGSLIDSCGLKALTKGGAQVSRMHANFIINLGTATYDDVDYLIQEIKEKVNKRHNIVLEEEIKRWV